MTSSRRFPPPWSVEETDACFIVKAAAYRWRTSISRKSPAGERRQSCLPGARRGGSLQTSPNCRSSSQRAVGTVNPRPPDGVRFADCRFLDPRGVLDPSGSADPGRGEVEESVPVFRILADSARDRH